MWSARIIHNKSRNNGSRMSSGTGVERVKNDKKEGRRSNMLESLADVGMRPNGNLAKGRNCGESEAQIIITGILWAVANSKEVVVVFISHFAVSSMLHTVLRFTERVSTFGRGSCVDRADVGNPKARSGRS
jgi:hypothetical protein